MPGVDHPAVPARGLASERRRGARARTTRRPRFASAAPQARPTTPAPDDEDVDVGAHFVEAQQERGSRSGARGECEQQQREDRRGRAARTRSEPRCSGKKSCTPNKAASSTASARLKSRSQIKSVASSDCAEVSSSSSVWRSSSGSPASAPPATHVRDRQRAHQQRPLVHLRGDQRRRDRASRAGASANSNAITNSGDSDASGATHCTSRNSSMS